ncbi:MAG TPA: hypothetical protein VIU44_08140 [Gaiellaceae bacterium]
MAKSPSFGQIRPPNMTDQHGTDWFQIWQQLNRVGVATLVRVDSVTTTGQVAGVGQMDVTPMVKMVDGGANVSEHGSVKKIHYSRMQGGSKAIILDPKPGDIGIAVFCDRDTSIVRKTKKPSPPGSRRRFDVSDGVYVMTVLGSAPTSYVQFEDDGTIVISPDNGATFVKIAAGKITLHAAEIELDGNVRAGGTASTATRPVSAIGTTTTDGASDNGNFLTKVFGL